MVLAPLWVIAAAAKLRGRSQADIERPDRWVPTNEQMSLLLPEFFEDGIFLSYRRDDTQGFARSIYDRLASKYGSEKVFRDVDSIPAGVKFPDRIQDQVIRSRIMIVLIGKDWLRAKDKQGRRRLDLADDWVRQEISMALSTETPIIPVLLQGARMPSKNKLPPPIADLAIYNYAEVTDSRWDYDIGELIKGIETLMALPLRPVRRPPADPDPFRWKFPE